MLSSGGLPYAAAFGDDTFWSALVHGICCIAAVGMFVLNVKALHGAAAAAGCSLMHAGYGDWLRHCCW